MSKKLSLSASILVASTVLLSIPGHSDIGISVNLMRSGRGVALVKEQQQQVKNTGSSYQSLFQDVATQAETSDKQESNSKEIPSVTLSSTTQDVTSSNDTSFESNDKVNTRDIEEEDDDDFVELTQNSDDKSEKASSSRSKWVKPAVIGGTLLTIGSTIFAIWKNWDKISQWGWVKKVCGLLKKDEQNNGNKRGFFNNEMNI